MYASCTRDDWITWRRILEARLALPANEASPYLNFCLAWALLSMDEPVRALQVLRANEALAIGNRRRIGTLAVITDTDGAPIQYQGIVRRVEGQQVVVYVARLLTEVRVPARVQSALAVAVHVGDEWVRTRPQLSRRSARSGWRLARGLSVSDAGTPDEPSWLGLLRSPSEWQHFFGPASAPVVSKPPVTQLGGSSLQSGL